MAPALFGIETELAITAFETVDGDPPIRRAAPSRVQDAGSLFGREISRLGGSGSSSNVFLRNGARFYLDVGSHPEYATPECTTLHELIAAIKAGERIVERTRQGAAERGRDQRISAMSLTANNRDDSGQTWGCHENYLAPRGDTTQLATLQNTLLTFFVSRQLVAGTGYVDRSAGAGKWCLSQRYNVFEEAIGSSTTRARAIINTRDEPHADSTRFRRLHLIVGDTNMSEVATFLKVGTTQLVIDLVAAGVAPDITLQNPVEAMRVVGGDLTGSARVGLANGGTTSGVEIQEAYLAAAERYFADHESSLSREETDAVLARWRYTVDALATHDLDTIVERLGTTIDWVMKYRLVSQYCTKNDISITSARARHLDISYHDLDPDRGLYNMLVRRGRAERLVDDATVELFETTPPQTSRAKLRGAFIDAAQRSRTPIACDWQVMRISDTTDRTFKITDPLTTEDSGLEAVIAQMAAVAERREAVVAPAASTPASPAPVSPSPPSRPAANEGLIGI